MIFRLLATALLALQLLSIIEHAEFSHLAFDVGSGAASQLFRQLIHQLLSAPRPVIVSFRTHRQPLLSPLAYIETFNRLTYSNITVKFYPDTIRLKASNVRLQSRSNITPNIWPMSFGDEIVHLGLYIGDVELAARVEEQKARMLSCSLRDTLINASSSNYWLAGKLLTFAANPLQSHLQQFMCPFLANYIANIESPLTMNISLYEILPPHIHDMINSTDSSLFYRVTSLTVEEKHILITAEITWTKATIENGGQSQANITGMQMKWDNEDRLTIWIDDTTINEFLDQMDWNFQWMEELIAVTSPVIPLSSREFLSTLCTSCYFLLNVWAKGPPVIRTINETIVFEKRDRINLRVVNPDKNVTSVFVSMILSLMAELRPVIDSGTLRTLVQLLDTNVVMENGAFPPSWSFFVQDLVKGMIIEMMWPELKKQIEELTYSEGIQLAASCGVDPQNTEILIGDGQLGVTATLILQSFQSQQCVKDLKSALPNTAKLFPK